MTALNPSSVAKPKIDFEKFAGTILSQTKGKTDLVKKYFDKIDQA